MTLFNIFLEVLIKEMKDMDKSLALIDALSKDVKYSDNMIFISMIFHNLKISH